MTSVLLRPQPAILPCGAKIIEHPVRASVKHKCTYKGRERYIFAERNDIHNSANVKTNPQQEAFFIDGLIDVNVLLRRHCKDASNGFAALKRLLHHSQIAMARMQRFYNL